MKKLLALLVACTAITCSFASCGEKEEDSASDSLVISDESSEESSEEEETTEESTEEIEEDTTEAVEKTTYQYIEDGDPTPFLGKWECEKMVIDGNEMTELMGIPVYVVFQLEIKDDFTAVMAESATEMIDAESAITYTWGIISDTEIEIVNETGDSMLLTLDGDYLVGTEEGYEEQIYLTNVDEFTPFDMEEFMNSLEMPELDEDVTTDEESEESESSDESSEGASTEIAE
ncbi:MAG: hypothetical protein K2J08_10460 [Ruminococcus sp.]|nr:hypothetical protein [Ruminococcus sp.]